MKTRIILLAIFFAAFMPAPESEATNGTLTILKNARKKAVDPRRQAIDLTIIENGVVLNLGRIEADSANIVISASRQSRGLEINCNGVILSKIDNQYYPLETRLYIDGGGKVIIPNSYDSFFWMVIYYYPSSGINSVYIGRKLKINPAP